MEDKITNLTKAVDKIIHLHMCEQEGISSGMPTPEQWEKAVDDLHEANEGVKSIQKE